jgi:predicted RNase H-like HicB family nuclease
MSTTLAFTVVLTPVEGGWTQAQLRELPGVVTCAPTEEAARVAVVDALREYLSSFAEAGDDAPTAAKTGLIRVTIDAA